MNFINDVYFIVGLGRRILRLTPDVADFLHPVVGGRIDFDYVTQRPVGDCLTDGALVTRLTVLLVMTVNSLGKNLSRRRFPGPPGASK